MIPFNGLIYCLLSCLFVIASPERFFYAKLGHDYELICDVNQKGTNITYLQRGKTIYESGREEENYLRFNHHKYRISNEGKRRYILTLRNAIFDDASTIQCIDSESRKAIETYYFIIQGTPSIYTVGSHLEGTNLTTVCAVDFSISSATSCTKQSKNKMVDCPDLELLHGNATTHIHGSHASCRTDRRDMIKRCKLKSSFSIIASRDDNGMNRTCLLQANAIKDSIAIKLIIKYAVAKPNVQPIKNSFRVGEAVECVAYGNPPPEYLWRNINTKDEIKCQKLSITKNMEGHNNWTCRAENEPGYERIVEETSIAFDVEHLPSNSLTTTFVVLTAISITTLLIALSSFFLWYRRRMKKPDMQCYQEMPEL